MADVDMSTTAANRVRTISWIPFAWFLLLGIGEIFTLAIYAIDRDTYRFPLDWGWSYHSATNYVLAQIGGLLFAAAGLSLCWQARRSGKWVYLAICIAAIALNYAIELPLPVPSVLAPGANSPLMLSERR